MAKRHFGCIFAPGSNRTQCCFFWVSLTWCHSWYLKHDFEKWERSLVPLVTLPHCLLSRYLCVWLLHLTLFFSHLPFVERIFKMHSSPEIQNYGSQSKCDSARLWIKAIKQMSMFSFYFYSFQKRYSLEWPHETDTSEWFASANFLPIWWSLE